MTKTLQGVDIIPKDCPSCGNKVKITNKFYKCKHAKIVMYGGLMTGIVVGITLSVGELIIFKSWHYYFAIVVTFGIGAFANNLANGYPAMRDLKCTKCPWKGSYCVPKAGRSR